MPQKGRKNSVIVSVLLPVTTVKEIDDICRDSPVRCSLPYTRSGWIRKAIKYQLDHTQRSRGRRRRK